MRRILLKVSRRPKVDSTVRVRRARSLLVSWQERKLVLMNYLTRVSASVAPEAVQILHLLEDWTQVSDLFSMLPGYSPRSVLAGISGLLKNTFLVEEGTPEAKRDADLARVWSNWLPYASFHFATKDVRFLSLNQYRRLPKRIFKNAPPSLLKSYSKAPRIYLPREHIPEGEFTRVLMARRTHRDYSGKHITLSLLSKLLHYTWGVTGRIGRPPLGPSFLKTSPSGGARHPGEVYVLAIRIQGLAQGLYHYDGLHHRLERLKATPARKKASAYTAGQDFLQDASALFLMTAVFPRSMWKYRFARAYRVVLLDAGHLCQTFCLVATWLGLAPFCTAALKDTLIEKDLGLDGIREAAIYVAGVGTRAEA